MSVVTQPTLELGETAVMFQSVRVSDPSKAKQLLREQIQSRKEEIDFLSGLQELLQDDEEKSEYE